MCDLGIGDVAFGSVDNVMIAVPDCCGSQRGGIRTGFRFREAKAGDPIAGGVSWQVLLLLFFCPVKYHRCGADAVVGSHDGAKSGGGSS